MHVISTLTCIIFCWCSNPDSQDAISSILAAVDAIEDNLYYFSDVISAGVPDLGRLITDNILQLLVFPLLLPSLRKQKTVSIYFYLNRGVSCFLFFLCKCFFFIYVTGNRNRHHHLFIFALLCVADCENQRVS